MRNAAVRQGSAAAPERTAPLPFSEYPDFADSLQYTFMEGDEISSGKDAADIRRREQLLGMELPREVFRFFGCASSVLLDGIRINLSALYKISLLGKEYCVLGEYWKEADGDLLLCLPGDPVIYYYAHTRDKVTPLCPNFKELMEQEFAKYNKSK